MLKISVITSPTNWYLYQLVDLNIFEVINNKQRRQFNYWDDFSFYHIRDQNTGGALLEFSMRTAMQGTSCYFFSAISVIINKISLCSPTSGIAQWVRRWTRDHIGWCKVWVRDVYQNCSSNYFYLSFMPGQVDFSDIAILCNRPNNCYQQNLKCFDEPLFSWGLFSRKSNNGSVTLFKVQPGLGPQCPKCVEMVSSIACQRKQDSG